MSTTIEQIKLDIASGISTAIFMSAHTLWWTHLDKDVEEATGQGRRSMEAKRKRIQDDPKISDKAKEVAEILYKRTMSTMVIPVDPTGSPLMIVDKPLEFLDEIEKSKDGPSLDLFEKQHHQNCAGKIYSSYEAYKQATNN